VSLPTAARASRYGFNPVLGFLSQYRTLGLFQSRAGFSECLDAWFEIRQLERFQSRAGFSECLDSTPPRDQVGPYLSAVSIPCWVFLSRGPLRRFQSRAGFSECLDFAKHTNSGIQRFNPVLGFLSVSRRPWTVVSIPCWVFCPAFQSRAGFSECLDPAPFDDVSIPCWVF